MEKYPKRAKKEAPMKAIREAQGLYSKDVAHKVGVSPSTISMIENGNSYPHLLLARKLSKFFGYSIEELFFGD